MLSTYVYFDNGSRNYSVSGSEFKGVVLLRAEQKKQVRF